MNMIANADMYRMLEEIKLSTDQDKYGGQMLYARQKMIELGFFDTMPETALSPFRDAPADWTAFELSIFDNGVPAKPKRARSYIQRTKMQFVATIKLWTRDKVNFRQSSQVSWKTNAPLWTHEIANRVASELLAQKLIDQNTVNDMKTITEQFGDGWMFSIPQTRTQEAGTRWMKAHLLCIKFEDGKPTSAHLIGPDVSIEGNAFSEQSADGKDLDDKVMAQLRLGSNASFDRWATQPYIAG